MGIHQHIVENATFICEDVSSLEYRGGLFYLTDNLGPVTITRAMRPETFIKCVTGAYQLAQAWQAEQAALRAIDAISGKVIPLR